MTRTSLAVAVLLLSACPIQSPAQDSEEITLNGYASDSPRSATVQEIRAMWESKLPAALAASGVRHPRSAAAIADLLNTAFAEKHKVRWNEALLLALTDSFHECSDHNCTRPFAFLGQVHLTYPADRQSTALIIEALGFIASWNRIKAEREIPGGMLPRNNLEGYVLGPGCRRGELCAAKFALYSLTSMHADIERNSLNDTFLHQKLHGMKSAEKDDGLRALVEQLLNLINRHHFVP